MTAAEATEFLSVGEFLARLATLGFQASPEQLARWRHNGLMPSAKQCALGRGAGSVTLLCSNEIGRAAAIVELLNKRRNFADVRWELWRRGYDIDVKYWRPHLLAAAKMFDSVAEYFRRVLDAEDDALEREADRLFVTRTANRFFRQLRKRLQRSRFCAFIFFTAQISAAQFDDLAPGSESNDKDRRDAAQIVDAGFGLTRARTDYAGEIGPVITGDYSSTLKAVSDTFASTTMTNALATMSDEELITTKEEWFGLLQILASGVRNVEAQFGVGAFGLRIAGSLFHILDRNIQAMCIVGWAMLRKNSDIRGRTDELLNVEHRAAPSTPPRLRKTKNVFPFKAI